MLLAVETPSEKTMICPDTRWAAWGFALLSIAVFSALSLTLAVKSTAFLEGDACTHYIYARAAFSEPYYLVDVWGRPFATALYTLPAHFGGRLAVRVTSLVVAISIGLISLNIARGQGWRWPVLALMFTLAQPLVFLHSFSELTELPFALLMALGFLAYQRRQFFWMALVIGAAPLSRPEGFAFLALAGLALVCHRRWWWLIVLMFPVVLWDYTGWRMFGEPGHWWHWLAANWPYDKHSVYTPGSLLYFVEMLPAVVSPFVFPATILGFAVCLIGERWPNARPAAMISSSPEAARQTLNYYNPKSSPKPLQLPRFFIDHRYRCSALIALLPLAVLAGHSFLYWRGAMSSNGEVRYMLVVAPFWALLSSRGWEWCYVKLDLRKPLVFAAIAAILPVGTNWIYKVLPVVTMPDWVEAKQIADWYQKDGVSNRYPYLASSHPALLYWLDISPSNPWVKEWRKDILDSKPPPPGTILIWDRIGALFNSDSSRTISLDELHRAGWEPMDPDDVPVDGGAGEWHFLRSTPLKEPSPPKLIDDGQTPDQVKAIEAFVAYCRTQGVLLEPDQNAGDWMVVAPPSKGYDVLVNFKLFPPATPAATMRQSLLKFQLAYPYLDEAAGIAMSNSSLRGQPTIPAGATEKAKPIEYQIAGMLREYRP